MFRLGDGLKERFGLCSSECPGVDKLGGLVRRGWIEGGG